MESIEHSRSRTTRRGSPERVFVFGMLPSDRPLSPPSQAERFLGWALWLLLAAVLLWTGT